MTDPSLIGTATVFEEEVTDELIVTVFEEEVTGELIPEDINKHNETSSSSVKDIRIVSLKENKELVINSAEWLLKPKPSDEDATSAERLSLVSESKSNTTELQDVPTKSKVMEQYLLRY